MTNWVDRFLIVRRLTLAIAIWMTWAVSEWAMWFATGNARNGLEMAAIIAAVTAPVTAFGAFIFKVYAEGKRI